MILWRSLDLPRRALRRLKGDKRDYRHFLFEDLKARLGERRVSNVLEIGPMEADDTKRLLTLAPDRLTLAEMPQWTEHLEKNLAAKGIADKVEIRVGNVMYDTMFDDLVPFDLIWCTGVLYHNPEQLRMLARLYDWLAPDGLLVMETATARRALMRDRNCVEIWHDVPKSVMTRSHLSANVTHVPSRKAVGAWLAMVGFDDIVLSSCHARQSFSLAQNRVAYIAQRAGATEPESYYIHSGRSFPIGRAL